MPTTHAKVSREDVQAALSAVELGRLQAVLRAGGLDTPDEDRSEAAAKRLVDGLWWRTHTPAGNLLAPDSLDAIVERTARKLGLADLLPDGDAWSRLAALTDRLLPEDEPLSIDELDPEMKEKLSRVLWPAMLGTGAAGTAAGSRVAAKALLNLTSGPLWKYISLLPRIGPIYASLRKGAKTVAGVSGPVGIALALWSLNQTLGAEYDRALPLLLGVGLLRRPPLPGTEGVGEAEAVEVETSAEGESEGDPEIEVAGESEGDPEIEVASESEVEPEVEPVQEGEE